MIRIGSTEMISSHLLPQLLVRWAAQYPNVPIRQRVLSPDSICAALRQDELDIGFTHGMEGEEGLLAYRWLDKDWLVVARPQHPLAHTAGQISFDMLRQARWVWLAMSERAEDPIRERFERHIGAVHVSLALGSPQAVISIAQESDLLAFLPRYAVEHSLNLNALSVLATKVTPAIVPLNIVRNPVVPLSQETANFLDLCQNKGRIF